jgi:hypothetical protein
LTFDPTKSDIVTFSPSGFRSTRMLYQESNEKDNPSTACSDLIRLEVERR